MNQKLSLVRLHRRPLMFVFVCLTTIILTNSAPAAQAVDCFKCSSRNGSNPACEDPFHNLHTVRITSPILPEQPPDVVYHTPCYAGKKGREGLFPASACVKITGTFDQTGETLMVRHCALDSGTLTQDTELGKYLAKSPEYPAATNKAYPFLLNWLTINTNMIPSALIALLVRMSHCGKFQFENNLLKGCVSVCTEDACNSVPSVNHRLSWALLTVTLALVTIFISSTYMI